MYDSGYAATRDAGDNETIFRVCSLKRESNEAARCLLAYKTLAIEQTERAHQASARMVRQGVAGEALTMTAWRWVAGACAERPHGAETRMTSSG
jgi:hypothetical protein